MILIVDNDSGVLEMLSEHLKKRGYMVRTAHTTVDAYKTVRNPRCKLMILDLNMPGINGAELLLLMASESIDVPTIVTASGIPDLTEEEMEQFPHVVGFIKKPYTRDKIFALIDKHAKKYEG